MCLGHVVIKYHSPNVNVARVEFRVTIFHYPHLQRKALSKAFPSYVIPAYRAVSFVVVRHRRLVHDYWAAILYRLGFIALSRFGGVYFVGTHDAF